MEITDVLNRFSKKCGETLNLLGILQFGSSTYSKNPNDIDTVFFSKDKVFSTENYFTLFKIINEFEQKYKDIVFDIAGGKRKRKAKYSITIVPLQMLDLDFKIDSFFLKNLSEDKNKRILFGEDPTDIKIDLKKEDIVEKLSLEINHALRNCLEEEDRSEALYGLFKVTLRLMLINCGILKKDELLHRFKNNFNIALPNNSEEILDNNITKRDLEAVLKFSENCLLYLSS